MPGRSYQSSNGYRYGFNGKENDKETVGTGDGTQDYGMRIYNPALGKFLSVDPLTREYPELTPYQFASNTPIQAVDLDGLEAVKVDIAARATFLIVSVAISVNVVAAPDGVAFFITPEAGLGAGLSVGAGVAVSYYPNVTEASQVGGWGVSAGFSIMGNGVDVAASIQQNDNGTPVDTKLGGAVAVPRLGAGAGAEGHLTGSYSVQIGKTLTWKEINSKLAEIAKGLGLETNELQKAVEKAKEEQLKLSKQQTTQPIDTKKSQPPVKKEEKANTTVTPKQNKTNSGEKKKSDAPKDKGTAKKILG
jgi:RHS repeat-associated protein